MLSDVVWPATEAPTARELARTSAAAKAPLAGDVPSPIGSLSEAALEHVRHRRILSAGALESYADCPVRWLIERELQPEKLEPDPDPLVRGAYMHNVIEQVLAPPWRAGHAPDAPARARDPRRGPRPGAARDRASAAARRSGPPRSRALAADLRRYLAHEARDGLDWQPYGLELRFGFDEGDERESDERRRSLLGTRPRRRRTRARDHRPRRHRRARTRGRARLQERRHPPRVPGRALDARPPAPGRAVHARGTRAARPRARRRLLPAARRRRPARPRRVPRGRRASAARSSPTTRATSEELDDLLEDARARSVALAARLRAGELEPCPTHCSRDGCRYPGICRA